MRRALLCILAVLLTAAPSSAQFTNFGNEPAGLRWYQIKTPTYKILYPEGLDSLARVYAARLEQAKESVGVTAGYAPNENFRKPLPVILHPYLAYSNGMVAWMPSRMELYTTPDFSAPLPMPWEEHLTLHEARHVSQMQFANHKRYRIPNIILGQLFQGAMDGAYAGPAFYEGDAVVAETELTLSGRGRNAAFLEYFRAAFREDDMRDWWKWRYGSVKNYTPDYYRVGYITAAGMRSLYDAPDFTARFYSRIFARKCWPWPLLVYPKTVKQVSGKKFRAAFAEICDTLKQEWARDEAVRAPFQPSAQRTPAGKHYVEYYGGCRMDSTLFSIRRGLTESPKLVSLDPEEKVPKVIAPFSGSTSALKSNEPLGRLYWSEVVPDMRYDLISFSEVWYMMPDGPKQRLKKGTRWYNPAVSPDGRSLAVIEPATDGSKAVLVVDAFSGLELERFAAPSGMQPVEAEWIGDEILACAVTSDGQGIYNVRQGFRRLLDCGPNTVKQLSVREGALYFVSDLNGVDELYRFEPEDGSVCRITSTPVGAGNFVFIGDELLYSETHRDGRHIFATPLDELPQPSRADFAVAHNYPFADELTAGGPGTVDFTKEPELPESTRYSKLAGAFRFHSWAPLYIDYDAVDDLSFESVTSAAGLGATAFFQNELDSFSGSVAYQLGYDDDRFTHAGELKFAYTGLYPIIEGKLRVGSDLPKWYYLQQYFSDFRYRRGLVSAPIEGIPAFDASVRIYMPLSFSSGGWYRGVVPQLRWAVSNSMISVGPAVYMNRLSASLRGYVVQSTPESCIYPKLGIGAETGWSGRPGATGMFEPNLYFYAYGYLPGLWDTHGVKLTGTLQMPQGDAMFVERYIAVMPRGMGDYSDLTSEASAYPRQCRLTVDYAFPFASLDWSGLGPLAYVRNLECTLHGDYSYFGGSKKVESLHLGSVGAEICVVLGNFIWVPADTRIGVKYYYNMGMPAGLNPHQVDMVFNIDL